MTRKIAMLTSGYNTGMSTYKFNHPITVRFMDIDSQRHVNNAKFISYLEDARYHYVVNLGLFDGKSFDELPLIVGETRCRYIAPIEPCSRVIVSMGVISIGTKSLTFGYEITGEDGSPLYARAETIMVTYDYHDKKSVPVSDEIRKRISDFEGKDFTKKHGS